jgi:hypothetical protein
MNAKEAILPEAMLSRRNLLISSAKLTAGAAVLLGTGTVAVAAPVVAEETPKMTDEIAASWTTF